MSQKLQAKVAAQRLIRRTFVWWLCGGLGLIQFGSRCDLYLPLSTRITVKPGEKVVGGETVVATRTLLGSHPTPVSATAHSE